MIPIHAKFTRIERIPSATAVEITQVVVGGPQAIINRKATLVISYDEALEMCTKLLKEICPYSKVREYADKLIDLANELRQGTNVTATQPKKVEGI